MAQNTIRVDTDKVTTHIVRLDLNSAFTERVQFDDQVILSFIVGDREKTVRLTPIEVRRLSMRDK